MLLRRCDTCAVESPDKYTNSVTDRVSDRVAVDESHEEPDCGTECVSYVYTDGVAPYDGTNHNGCV